MLLLQFGNMNKDLAKFNTRLFAEKVMPRLQPLFQRVGRPLVADAHGDRATCGSPGFRSWACGGVAAAFVASGLMPNGLLVR